MPHIGPSVSPSVGKTFQKREETKQKKTLQRWGLLNILLVAVMYWDMQFGPVIEVLSSLHPVFWYAEFILAVVFGLNALVMLLQYFSIMFHSSFVELNLFQWKLLGVKDTEPGFCTPNPQRQSSAVSPDSTNRGLVISPSNYSPHTFSSPYSPTNSPYPVTPGPVAFSPSGSLSPSPTRSLSPGSGSFLQNTSILNKSASFNATQSPGGYNSFSGHYPMNRSTALSPNTSLQSPVYHDDSSFGLRPRFNQSLRNTSMKSEDDFKDKKELEAFLREQEELDMKQHAGSPDGNATAGSGHSFWSYNRSLVDYSPMLRKYTYQLACRSPQSTKAKDDDTDDGPAQYEANEIWLRAGVHVADVDIWIEYLRKWIGQTIMGRVVSEIDSVNKSLKRIGSDEQIGEVSISTLKQLALMKGQHINSLNTLLSFLDVTSNQEYLIKRVRELGSGGCMSDFTWNGGSNYKGKPWTENLPNDSEIVMHMLCSYMDARLPGHPKHYGKTFSTLHFLKTPSKPDLEKKDNMIIYQTKINPPHYKVVLGDDIWNMPKGRNNLFYAILLFLHHIKTKQNGMLGRVNLGLSGVNILWILETHL